MRTYSKIAGLMTCVCLAAQAAMASSFSGVVWSDCDKDGIRQPGEAGVQGIEIRVYDAVTGGFVASEFTKVDGTFHFTDQQAGFWGTYQVQYVVPTNYFSPTVWPPLRPFPSPTATQIVSTASAEWGGFSPTFTFDGRFVLGDVTLNNAGICLPEPLNPGTGTPGYWKNHPEAWPVDSIILGDVRYTRAEAIALMKLAIKGDKTLNLAAQLISAKLNVLIGNDSSCVAETIADTEAFLTLFPIGSNLAASSTAFRRVGSGLLATLDSYNNGKMCAPSRD